MVARASRGVLLRGALALCLCVGSSNLQAAADVDAQVKQLDGIKSTQYPQFAAQLNELRAQTGLTPPQQEFVGYLIGWQQAYEGKYQASLASLGAVIARTKDPTLQFRATVTEVNVLSITKRYEEAFVKLSTLLEQLPQIADIDARRQGLGVIALLYNQVGEYALAQTYAQRMINDDPQGKGACMGGQLKMQALYEGGTLTAPNAESQHWVDLCTRHGELIFANLIRVYVVGSFLKQGKTDLAKAMLEEHYAEVVRIRYPLLISTYDLLLAMSNYQAGNKGHARRFALSAVENSVKGQFTQPLIEGNKLLYTLSREAGELQAALEFYERYAAADKGYLDDVSARQLAYQRVRHEVSANKLEIQALSKQNEVLQLQRELDAKAIENVRLYIALLIAILGFIGFWAYKTKRSQLHFMMLSRRDGLTGIFNRPHFIELAKSALDNCSKMQQEVCLLLCDLDHFKSINDKLGHAGGDALLKQAVAACEPHLRGTDIFARIGGEEFCVLLPGCGLEAARQRAEQLRTSIAAIELSGLSVSASLGVTSSAQSGYELKQLMAEADAALYEAKRSGRNRVVVRGAKDPAGVAMALPESPGRRGVGIA